MGNGWGEGVEGGEGGEGGEGVETSKNLLAIKNNKPEIHRRGEERRVGKEGRSWWSPEHKKKN